MTGREKFQAAFSREGTREFPAAICYHGIFLRDHWNEVTRAPWWTQSDPDPETSTRAQIDMILGTGEDWFPVRPGPSRTVRRTVRIEPTPQGVFRVNTETGERTPLSRPPVGGDQSGIRQREYAPAAAAVRTIEEVDALMDGWLKWKRPATPAPTDDGSLDAARLLVARFGQEKLPLASIGAPCWSCYSLWGFDGLMTTMVEQPELIEHACQRYVEDRVRQVNHLAAAGTGAIWIEDCMTDMISPAQFRRFNRDMLRPITDAIRRAGMFSVHYFCGRPDDRWDSLLDTGADALSLEESKKNFDIDIAAVAERVDGRMALLGNLDAITLLETGSDEELRAEIARQCQAGRRNRSRFVVSLGSPVTPRTPLSRVRRYCDLVHEMQ